MRLITDEEFWDEDKLEKSRRGEGFHTFSITNEETSLKYLKRGIYPSVFPHIDRRYKSNHPPLEKDYPFLKDCLDEEELKKMNEDYYSLMRGHLKEFPLSK